MKRKMKEERLIDGVRMDDHISKGERLENIDNCKNLPEAVFREIIDVNDRVDGMNLKEVMDKLKSFHVNSNGSEDELKERLKKSYEKVILASGKDMSVSNMIFPYYVVIDFEATCDNKKIDRQEIIEFPAVLVNSKKQKIEDCFRMYCKPRINPKLSQYCMELTGITQEQVDNAETFDKVLSHYNNWLKKHNLGTKNKRYAVVTDGNWDMSKFLVSQCHYSNVPIPKWGKTWVNLKKTFKNFYQKGENRICLKTMLEMLNMEFIGRPHCGLDDAKNIARILLKMIYDGSNIQINERLASVRRVNINKNINDDDTEDSRTTLNDGDKSNMEDMDEEQIPKFKVKTYVQSINSTGKTYNRIRRQRLTAQTHLAREMFKKSNDVINLTIN
ncbi:3' histone mRNA exonuclease, putative [Pediculus humanus corporis]|uniref:3' histone mRNA exonuclease, putative n=1 Tax=Pediculus humanus subsp. corporis TaxID=121224 RepID=E0VP69_PEDHC|nr:3' histone mRNA exonuclease, putative [Pediculus humanus corporis]EEB15175.1 3' histone mRNA exonuclease, putative [Pediculus humanus corporis]